MKDAYLKVNPDPKGLLAMFNRDVARMETLMDFSESDIISIKAPTLVLNSDADVVLPEHALELSRLLPHAQLAILPGYHGEYLGEICARDKNSKIPFLVMVLIEEFISS